MKKQILLLMWLLPAWAMAQTTRTAGTFAELNTAITNSANGDIISITGNIVATSTITINKSIIINGNDYTITVPVTGLDEMGRFATSPSTFRLLSITTTGSDVTFNNTTIMGGNPTGNGGAISVASGTILRMNRSVITRSRCSGGGGAIANSGTVFLNQSYIIRNAALYAGGFLNTGSTARAYVESSTLVENRSTGSGSGGGGAENQSGALMYFNNSTLSNNQSTEIGGAINNFNGTVFFVNSSATGNVCFGGSNSTGGAIGNNGGTVRIINSLMAHNYRRTTGSVTNPTGYVLDDVRAFSSQNNVHIYFSILHANQNTGTITQDVGLNGTLGTNLSNIIYSGAADGNNNTIFSGGILSRITDNNGTEIGDQVFRPFLLNNAGGVAPTLQPASFVLNSANRGTRTRFANNNNVNPVVAYWDGTAWQNLAGTGATGQEVITDQVGLSRPNPPARGAMEGVATDLYMVKVNVSGDGTVSGGSFQGDVYPSGTSVTLTAVPNASRAFQHWERTDVTPVTIYSTANPLTFTVTENITLRPVFTTLAMGSFTITYAGNSNTGGSAPAGGTFSASTNIASEGTLTRTGYNFTGWNTAANGSGTAYSSGAAYAGPANLVLYAQWQELVNTWNGTSGTLWTTATSWAASTIAPNNAKVIFASNASDNLTLDQNRTIRRLEFNGATRHVVLGNHNFSITDAITQFGTNSFIRTTGTGRLSQPLQPNETSVFPVGNSSYNPLTILNRTGRNETFSVQVKDEVYINGTNGTVLVIPRIRRTWDISNISGNSNAGDGIDLTFNWSVGDGTGVSQPVLYHFEGGSWNRITGDISFTATSLTIRNYKGSFSPFAIMDVTTTLPVSLSQFNARCNGNSVLISWVTESEQDNSHFIIERSTNGSVFKAIGNVPAQTNNNSTRYYQFTDTESGNAQYRLRQVDLNGKEQVFNTVSVRCGGTSLNIRIFPNPASDRLTIISAAGNRYTLINGKGQLMAEGVLAAPQQTISISQLPAGLYYLNIKGADGSTQTESLQIRR